MKTYLSLILAQFCFAASLWSQTPAPKSPGDVGTAYVVAAGELPQPGLIAYKDGMTFSEAVEVARRKDFNDWYHVRIVYLIRGGKKEKYDLKDLRADPSKDPKLQPWDIIYRPPVTF